MITKSRYNRLINELPNEGRRLVNGFRNNSLRYPESMEALESLERHGVMTPAMLKTATLLLELLLDEKVGDTP